LAVNNAELAGLEAAVLTVTDPAALESLNNRIIKLRNRVENLQVDLTSQGAVRLLKLQLDINQLETLVQITNTFIAGVEARKAAL